MRPVQFILGFAAAACLGAAATAAPVEVSPILVGERLSNKADDYGARELDRLTAELREAVTNRLERGGHTLVGEGGAVRIQITLENAWPNRPTRAQLSDEPGLSFRSVSLGGASVSAVIFDASGQSTDTLEYSWRTRSVADSVGLPTWHDADRTFDRFARQISNEVPGTES